MPPRGGWFCKEKGGGAEATCDKLAELEDEAITEAAAVMEAAVGMVGDLGFL